jgi:cyclohexa-1,5-dienecarbonyl-CoA hydratase
MAENKVGTITQSETVGFHVERHAPRRGAVTITLDNPPLNVLTLGMMDALCHTAGALADDDEIRVVLFRAVGKAFCAGADVKEQSQNPAEVMVNSIRRLCRTVFYLPQPTVCEVDGACMGGGMELMLCSDFVVASERAVFAVPEITLGIFPPVAVVLLPRRIGWAGAKDLLFLGRKIGAAEAKDVGLVLEAVPPEQVAAKTGELVDRLLSYSGAALRALKKALQESSGKPLPDAMAKVGEVYLDDLVPSGDHIEGFRAFLEKRQPRWNNK